MKMADCECLDTCPFFNDNMAAMPTMADIVKSRYCHDEHAACARYRVFKAIGREYVPADLFPNQADGPDGPVSST